MTIQRKGAERAKGYKDNKHNAIKISNAVKFCVLCVFALDFMIRGRGTVCSIKYKPMILFGRMFSAFNPHLSLVKAVSILHSATLELLDHHPGLRVICRFPHASKK